jgi:Arc/MetJ family transcription regulator
MRTNIVIDDELMREAQAATGLATKKETVDHALREVVAQARRRALLELRGKVNWEGDLDEMRRGRV